MKNIKSNKRTVLGVTLTKQGWNNVIIFVVLGLMFIFYFLGDTSSRMTTEDSFRPFAVYNIVELRDSNHDLIRVGKQWELRQGQLTSAEQKRWLNAWQNLTLKPYNELLAGDEYSVEVSVADQSGSLHITVFMQPDKVLVALPGYDKVLLATHAEAQDLRPVR